MPQRPTTKGRLLIGLFCAILVSPWLIGLGFDEVNENQAETDWPTFTSPSDIINTAKYQALDQVLRKRSTLSRIAVPVIGAVGYGVLQRSMREDVWQGSDGELFLSEDFRKCRKVYAGENEAQAWAAEAQAQPTHPVRFIVPANKSTGFAQYLKPPGPSASVDALTMCSKRATAFVNKLAKASPDVITTVGPSAPQSARFNQPEYYPGDTHWSPAAATNLALQTGPWLAPETVQPKLIADSLVESAELLPGQYSDLYILAGVREPGVQAPIIDLQLPDSGQASKEVVGTFVNREAVRYQNPNAPIAGRTLVFYDSFMLPAVDSYEPLFKDAIFVSRHTTSEFRQWYLATHPNELVDRIIIESVERDAAEVIPEAILRAEPIWDLLTPEAQKSVPTAAFARKSAFK